MNATRPPRSWIWRVFRLLAVTLLFLAVILTVRGLYAFRDRDPAATFRLRLEPSADVGTTNSLRVGFGRVKITPDLGDPAPPVWLAGFSQNRAATAIHDDLWAIACVVDDGARRMGMVALDAIGLFHDDVMKIRRGLAAEWKIQYAVVCATHNHSTPDLMGLWGKDYLHTGVNPRYQAQVIAASVKALGEAVAALQPAQMSWHEIPTAPEGLVADTRPPKVFDCDIRVLHFTHPATGATLGSIVNWGNHPETVWGQNTEITSDFCGYLREALEQGIVQDGKVVEPGLGGTHLFINGAVGGLMSTTPRVSVRDPYLGQDYQEPSHDKARAVGRQLFSRIKPRLVEAHTPAHSAFPITVRAQTVLLPANNLGFLLAPILGIMDRGHAGWFKLRSEVALIQLGDVSIACLPGEIYPELVNGGVERAPGGDYDLEPLEVPPIRTLMPGSIKLVFGLANDEIGYVIPLSEWDQKPPYLYGSTKQLYGEINSLGPKTAGILHAAMRELCAQPATRP